MVYLTSCESNIFLNLILYLCNINIVTVERNGEIVDAEVISVETYKETEVPFPLDKVKDIIDKENNYINIE